MNKTIGIILGVVALVLIGIFVYMNLNKPAATTTTNNNNTSTTTDNGSTGTGTTGSTSTTNAISIINETFTPSTTTVKVGTKVTWTNNDSFTHTVAFDDTSIQS